MGTRIMTKDVLNALDEKSWWLLFIDKQDQYKGEQAYDNEVSPGFHESMTKTFCQFLADDDELKRPINSNKYYKMYEAIAKDNKSEDVSSSYEDTKSPPQQSHYTTMKIEGEALKELEQKKVGDRYLLGHINKLNVAEIDSDRTHVSYLASDEIFQVLHQDQKKKYSDQNDNSFTLKEEAKKNSSVLTKISYNQDQQKEIIDGIFKEHYEAIESEESKIGKIDVIADTVRALHVMHPFTDGNGRLNMPLVMNNLLCDAGFCPAILPNGPGVFGGHKAVSELTSDISKGMNSFVQMVKKEKGQIDLPEEVTQNVLSVSNELRERQQERYLRGDFKRSLSEESLQSFGGDSDSEKEKQTEEKKPSVNPRDIFRKGRGGRS